MGIIVPIPRSGKYACRNHMVEKSPEVHPTRHLVVLIDALFHVSFEVQKPRFVMLSESGFV